MADIDLTDVAISWSVNDNTGYATHTYTVNPYEYVDACAEEKGNSNIPYEAVRYWIKEELKKFFDQITNEKLEVDVDALQEYINNFKVD